ncbi:Phosphatidylinositol-4-phosphate 5-kinase [Microsporum ferrugineum]
MLAFTGGEDKAEGNWRVDYLVIEQPPSPPAHRQRLFPQTMPALSSPDTSTSARQHTHHHQPAAGSKTAAAATATSPALFGHSTSKASHDNNKAAAHILWNHDLKIGDTGDGVTASANFFVDGRSKGPNSKAGATVSVSPSRERTESTDSSLRNGRVVSSNPMADEARTNGIHEANVDEHHERRWTNGTGQSQQQTTSVEACRIQQQTVNGLPYRPSSKATTNYSHPYTGYPPTAAELTPPSSSSQNDDVGPAPTRPPPPIPTSIPTTPTPKSTNLDTTAAPTTGLDTGLAPELPNTHRHSSPHPQGSTTAPSDTPTSPSSLQSARLAHRHTLQVPRHSSSRASRDTSTPIAVDDTLLPIDRVSSPTSVLRRGSFTIPRLTPRSNQSEPHLDEALQDEGAARWTEAFKQRRASKRKRREEEDEDRVIVGTKVDMHHVNWVTAYNMLTGIRFTVSRTNAKLDRELTDADFDAKHKFSFDITGNELTPSAKYDFKFKDYAPWVFRRLRAKFQLDPADYLMSLTSKYILSELGSPGKSGSFFYFSRDYKYIIKTIHHAEHKLLRRILREYYAHIENNPNTLISQFYGLHRVKMAYGRKIHFVVMNNLFPPHRDIHQMYDLKGSTVGRDFKEEDLEANPRATLKDLNWLRRNRHLNCGKAKREVFLAQLRRDVTLLQKLKIMDYSLLIGIHDVEKGNEEKLRDRTLQIFQPGGDLADEQQPNLLMRTPSRLENARKARELREMIKREKPVPMEHTTAKMPDEVLDERKNLVFYSDDGGLRATHENGDPGDEIYYLGVIDCLTHYGMVKKAEHFWKGLSHNSSQISPIPPEAYGERFLEFITSITKSKEEVEREKQNAEATPAQTEEPTPSEKKSTDAQKPASGHPEASRTLKTVNAPADFSGGGTATLPVVEEAGENCSTGGKSGRSNASRGGDDAPADEEQWMSIETRRYSFRTARSPAGPPPVSAPPPPPPPKINGDGIGPNKQMNYLTDSNGTNNAVRNGIERDKKLPPTPGPTNDRPPMPQRPPPPTPPA